MEGEYTINNSFRMTIKRNHDNYYINFGGSNPKLTCIDIFVYDNISSAKLQQIDYDTKCNLEGNLSNGLGTRDMIQAALFSITHLFPEIKTIQLEDYSNIKCDNGLSVSLASYYLAFNEETWYEKYFGAIPITKYKYLYQESKNNFTNSNIKKELKWFHELIRMSNLDSRYHKYLLETYTQSNTYREFFDKLKKHYSKSELCIATRNWIHRFIIEEIFLISMCHWEIDLKNYFSNIFIKVVKN